MKRIYLLLACFSFVFNALNAQKNLPDVSLCGTIEDPQMTENIRQMMKEIALKNNNKLRPQDSPMRECLVAVTVDKTLFDYYLGDKEVIKNRVYELFAEVSTLFEKELSIKIIVSHIEFWESKSYTSLGELDQYWANIPQKQVKRHLVHLLKTDNVDRNAAGIGYLGYGVASTGFANYASAATTIAHEIGHNLGSPHTHSCLWPGGPIDWCSSENGIKEGCMDYVSSQSRIGTVMSYCGNRKFSFHPLCIELMKGYAEDIYELPIISNAPVSPSIANENVRLANMSLTPFLNWNYSGATNTYRIQVSEIADFSTIVNDSTLAYNQFQAYNLKPETTYYWRVKAKNTKGESNWSDMGAFTTDRIVDLPPVPVVKGPLNNAKEINSANFSFYPSPTATEYEIELIDEISKEIYGTKEYNLIRTTETAVYIDLYRDEHIYRLQPNYKLYWRVRAKNGAGYSMWSRYHTFDRGVYISNTYPYDLATDIPTNAVFSWESHDVHIDKKTELQVSTQKDFSSNVISQQYAFNEVNKIGFSTFFGKGNLNLQPNTKYYYRIRDALNPNTVWVNNSFTTVSNSTESNKWKLINDFNSSLRKSTYINSFYLNPQNNTIWIGANGAKLTDGVNWTEDYDIFNTRGALEEGISSMTVDGKGNLWAANGEKLLKFNNHETTVFNESNSPINNLISGVVTDKNDHVYTLLGQYNGLPMLLSKYDGENWSQIESPFDTTDPPFLRLDSEGNIWGADSRKIAKLVGSQWVSYPIDRNLVYYTDEVFADKAGNIWLISPYNILKFTKEGTFTTMNPAGYYYFNYPYMAFDKDNTPYLTFNDGRNTSKLLKYADNQWIDLSKTPIPLEANNRNISGMGFDRSNRLWIATVFNGIFIYDEKGTVRAQSIKTESVVNKYVGSAPFALSASATSGLPVSFTIVSGPATIADNKVVLSGEAGKVIVRASQGGNENFEPAGNVEFSFEVRIKQAQQISFNALPAKTFGDAPFLIRATTSSGLPVQFSVISGPAIIKDNTLTLTGAGKVIVKATQIGNDEYLAAQDVVVEFCVLPGKATISSDATNPFLLKSSVASGNQWYLDGVKILGATASTYLSEKNGKYSVEIANPDKSCGSTISDVFELLVLAAEEQWTKEIKIFPNPISSNISISPPAGVLLEKVAIYDMSGKRVYENQNKQEKYDTSTLAKGIFFIDIQTNKGRALKKVIKE
jgi:hypothetical protein